jgi:long-chain acyl-CoA synthetase
MNLAPILRGLRPGVETDAIVDSAGVHSYHAVCDRFCDWRGRIGPVVQPHSVVSVEGDYSAEYVAALLALAEARAVLVPISNDSLAHRDEFLREAQVEWRVTPATGAIERVARTRSHELYRELETRNSAGLVLFTSGSTGRNKAALHDLGALVEKFAVQKRCLRTLVFLQPDHIGGINTLFYTLSNSGTLVIPENRQPSHICALIDRYGVELLPTSPTFLNLLLLAYDPVRHQLAGLKHITYGTEPMPEATLQRVRTAFPHVRLQQTYGLTEVGILRSKSRDDGSLWVKLGGEGFDLQVRDGRLWIKAHSSMLGYLNAPSPFSADGYLDTGDRVEVD